MTDNYAKRIRKRNREIAAYVDETAKEYGESFIKGLTPEQVEVLSEIPHPKLPESTLTAYDYVAWMCKQGWHKKAKALVTELLTPQEVTH